MGCVQKLLFPILIAQYNAHCTLPLAKVPSPRIIFYGTFKKLFKKNNFFKSKNLHVVGCVQKLLLPFLIAQYNAHCTLPLVKVPSPSLFFYGTFKKIHKKITFFSNPKISMLWVVSRNFYY